MIFHWKQYLFKCNISKKCQIYFLFTVFLASIELPSPVVTQQEAYAASTLHREPRVLTHAVLQNQEQMTNAIVEIADKLTEIFSVLHEINDSLIQIASATLRVS